MKSLELHIRKKLENYICNTYTSHYMQPSFRGNFEHVQKPKLSAVLLLLIPKQNTFNILYTLRTHNENDKHSGQISFPGGGFMFDDENLMQTAIRETSEEIGIHIHQNWIACKLTEQYIPISNYIVQPYVAILPQAPHSYTLQESEIASVIEVPLSYVQNKANIQSKQIEHNNQTITIPYYAWQQYEIWGVTAMITEELVECIRE